MSVGKAGAVVDAYSARHGFSAGMHEVVRAAVLVPAGKISGEG